VEFVSATGPYSYDSGTVTWNIGTLGPNESSCVTVTVRVKCAQPGSTITNQCEMIGDFISPIYADENTPVCPAPTLTKVDNIPDGNCVGPGSHITYNICYATHGYSDTNVVITDLLPPELEFISASGGGVNNSGTVSWYIGTLEPIESDCVTVTVRIKCPPLGATITNCCEMTGYCITSPLTACEDVCVGYPPSAGSIIYVDSNIADCNIYYGTSWQWPYKYLQDALDDASSSSICEEIWVAQGIYNPDADSSHPGGTGDREATFQLISGVTIKGGYAGGSKPDPNERNILKYETILSGDLAGNDSAPSEPEDMLTDPSRSENSFHVVTGSGVNNNTVLDGFTITGGNANSNDYDSNSLGGGIYNYGGSPTIRNCFFKWNSARGHPDWTPLGGGGMCNLYWGSPVSISNCLFKNNWANMGGGGLCNFSKDTNVINCTFIGNGADDSVGGVYASRTKYDETTITIVTNSILWGNEGGQISGSAVVTYSDIQDGWAGEGNIDEDPELEIDGIHLTLCSPCIDTGNNDPPGGLPETDIDGQSRIMNGHCISESTVDMGVDEFYIEDCNIWLYAHCPKPASGSTAAFYVDKAELSWKAGSESNDINGHQVYFGTDFDDVNEATTSTATIYRGIVTDPCYPLKNLYPDYNLILCKTYYWRVDEVNEVRPEPNFWKGGVWSFKFNLFVDDFSYSSQADLNKRWKTGYTLPVTPPYATNIVSGTISLVSGRMELAYDNSTQGGLYGPWSETMLDYNNPNGVDWTIGGVFEPCAIGIQFDGNTANTLNAVDANYDKMYMAIEDTNGRFGIAYNPDPFAPQKLICMEWKIPLTDLTSPNNVDLTEVNRVIVGIGNPRGGYYSSGGYNGGKGTLKFENLRLYLNICPQEYGPVGDLSGDFTVNLYDMKIMSQEWLTEGTIADIRPDCFVDFRDFAVLANQWLTEILPP
jgi:uncharacterized repeat protein (TIGR01451 family)